MLKFDNKEEQKLIDCLAEFTQKYKLDLHTVDRKPDFMKMLESVYNLLISNKQKLDNYQSEILTLREQVKAAEIKVKDSQKDLQTARQEIADLLDVPFKGKNDAEANMRIGADHAIHIVLEILDHHLNN